MLLALTQSAANPQLQVCCCGPGGQEISIDLLQQRRASAGIATLSVYVMADYRRCVIRRSPESSKYWSLQKTSNRHYLNIHYYSAPVVAEYCDERVICVCVSVCLRAYLRNCTPDLHQILGRIACTEFKDVASCCSCSVVFLSVCLLSVCLLVTTVNHTKTVEPI